MNIEIGKAIEIKNEDVLQVLIGLINDREAAQESQQAAGHVMRTATRILTKLVENEIDGLSEFNWRLDTKTLKVTALEDK